MKTKAQIPDWMLKEVMEYDLDMVPPPATILDIGANIGAFSLHYSAKWPAAEIHAYEPVKSNLADLHVNTSGNPRIHIHGHAVRLTWGKADIFLGDRGVTCGFFQRGRQTTRTELVECVAADTLPSADLVKIDTEGCETEILYGLPLGKTRAVVVEYHSQRDREEIELLMGAHMFALLKHIPGSATHGVLKFGRGLGVRLPGTVAPHAAKPASAPAKTPPMASGGLPARKIYLAVAGHYATYDITFVQSLCGLMLGSKVAVQIGWHIDSSVDRARNILTANFLASDCTHLLFVDSDIGFSEEDVARVTSHDEAMVGGLYPLKNTTPTVQWCLNGLATGDAVPRADGLLPVKYIGTGFLCIARRVFEEMIRLDGPAISYLQDFPPHRLEYAFWRDGVVERRFLTEDWLFCDRWLKMGGKVWADTHVVLRHAGRSEWPLPHQAGNPFAQEPGLSKKDTDVGDPYKTFPCVKCGTPMIAPGVQCSFCFHAPVTK